MNTTTLSITEARKRWNEVVNRVAYGGERIILLSRSKPKVAVVSLEDLLWLDHEKDEQAQRKAQMKAWLEETRALRERILERRSGIPLPDSVKELHALREERDEQILGLR